MKNALNLNQVAGEIAEYFSKLVDVPVGQVELDVPFSNYGLESTAAAALSGELSERFNLRLDPEVAFDYPTISLMAGHILSKLK